MNIDAIRRRFAFALLTGVLAVGAFAVQACAKTLLTSVPKGKGIKCSLAKIEDTQKTGLTAFTYFLPTGWESKSSMTWNGPTYIADFTANTPDNQYMVEQVQPFNLVYVNSNGKILQGFRIAKGIDYLHGLLNGLMQKGTLTNVRVLQEYNEDAPLTEVEKSLPKPLPSNGNMVQNTFNQTAFMKISFEKDGHQLVGSIGTTVYGTLLVNNMTLGNGRTARPFTNENGTYVVGPTLLVVTPPTPSAAKVKEAQIVASSGQMTPKFLQYCVQQALAMSNASLQATEERGKELIKQMREQTAEIKDNFEARMAQKDADTHEFCNYLLDQQDYKDSSGNVVTLPSAYTHSWTNGNGEYILNDDPTFDPKGIDFSTWQQLEKTK